MKSFVRLVLVLALVVAQMLGGNRGIGKCLASKVRNSQTPATHGLANTHVRPSVAVRRGRAREAVATALRRRIQRRLRLRKPAYATVDATIVPSRHRVHESKTRSTELSQAIVSWPVDRWAPYKATRRWETTLAKFPATLLRRTLRSFAFLCLAESSHFDLRATGARCILPPDTLNGREPFAEWERDDPLLPRAAQGTVLLFLWRSFCRGTPRLSRQVKRLVTGN